MIFILVQISCPWNCICVQIACNCNLPILKKKNSGGMHVGLYLGVNLSFV